MKNKEIRVQMEQPGKSEKADVKVKPLQWLNVKLTNEQSF